MKTRNYGIDLLRLVLMFMVCILHVLGQGGILRECEYDIYSAKYKIYYLLEVMCYCAVDAFALISGYMSSDKPLRYAKIIEMWFQTLFYSLVLSVVFLLLGLGEKQSIWKMLMPVTTGYYWYVTAFVAAFFFSPIIHKYISAVSEETAREMLLILLFLFSALGTLRDPFKTVNGYSALWLIVLYAVGALSRKCRLFSGKKTSFLLLLWICSAGFVWLLKVFLLEDKWINYLSPFIVLCGLLMVIVFSRLTLDGKIIRKLSPLAFGVYLFHLNPVIYTDLDGSTARLLSGNLLLGVLQVFLFAGIIFVCGIIVEWIRQRLAKLLHMQQLAEWLEKLFVKLVEKMKVVM